MAFALRYYFWKLNVNSIVFSQLFLLQASDPQAVTGIVKWLEMKSLVLTQLLLLLVRIFYNKSLSFFTHVLHPASFWMMRISSSFQFGTEMTVSAVFVRTRCRMVLWARVEMPLQSCENWKAIQDRDSVKAVTWKLAFLGFLLECWWTVSEKKDSLFRWD